MFVRKEFSAADLISAGEMKSTVRIEFGVYHIY